MKIFNLTFVIIFFLTSCGGFKEAGKVLRNEKTNSTDEFLVKKREPLILPPNHDKLPEPNALGENKKEEENKIKRILKKSENDISSEKSSSVENSILKNIRK